ncbi:MAG TPA: adenylate/guanylate cyclase domain-containing protein [Allosphingosinicella sp.]|jgi:class 3 adenylate cyclase|nr:adenylate/guanylate cyclase domain-containing protein [Allosphingosinicella sp.]
MAYRALTGRFADLETETRFAVEERRARLPSVRIYAALAAAVVLAYTVLNPFFFTLADEAWFMMLVVPTLVVLAGYFAATFWPRYPRHPAVDFVCLLVLGALVLADDFVLYSEFQRLAPGRHSAIIINPLIVTAFAAFALVGHTRWFLAWLGCHAALHGAVVLLFETETAGQIYGIVSYVSAAAAMLFLHWALDRAHRSSFLLREALEAERSKTEELLYNVLPPTVAQRLRDGEIVADSFSDASVIFIDVIGFSALAKSISPGHLVDLLNAFFSLADRCAARSGVEKVKTIGDAYLAISGGNAPARNSAGAALAFATAVIDGLPEVGAECGIDLQVRIGIHSGAVVGGVIGATRMAYDYWGETMNIASRIESAAGVNGIAVSEATWMRVRGSADFEPPETLVLKGVGQMPVYRLRRPPRHPGGSRNP